MIKSMTGYGRATGSFDGMNITLELKSVNHRYFEFSSRVPRNFGFLDEKLKSFSRENIKRQGRVLRSDRYGRRRIGCCQAQCRARKGISGGFQ